MKFDHFVAIDWSGAKGTRHKSIAVAQCWVGDQPPQLVCGNAGGLWSRMGVRDWLSAMAARGERTLIGMDAGFSLAFGDHGFFPGATDSPADARALWAQIEAWADDDDLGGHGYIDRRREWFWAGVRDGPRHLRARFRRTEQVYRAAGLGQPTSNFVLMGPAQVGKASLSAMRLLAQLPQIPVWPFDDRPVQGPLMVEIYCQAFARMGGERGKIRRLDRLNNALFGLRSAAMPTAFSADFTDHVSDALITAAGMRAIADDPRYWHPVHLSEVAATEGWTFGVA